MLNKIYAKNHINNSIASALYRYGHHYDSLESDIYVDTKIKKNEELILLLNSKMFSFINEIHVQFRNDFDNKIYFDNLPDELNKKIRSYLTDESSIQFDLYNLDILYNIDYKINKINKNLISCCLKFKLKDNYLHNLKKYKNIQELIHQLPNYLLSNNDYGIKTTSTLNRNLQFIITYMNYNNEEFYEFNEKYIKEILN